MYAAAATNESTKNLYSVLQDNDDETLHAAVSANENNCNDSSTMQQIENVHRGSMVGSDSSEWIACIWMMRRNSLL